MSVSTMTHVNSKFIVWIISYIWIIFFIFMVCPFLGTLQGNVHFVFHVCGSLWMSISKVSEKYFGTGNGMHKLKFGANKLEGLKVFMLVCGSIITMQGFKLATCGEFGRFFQFQYIPRWDGIWLETRCEIIWIGVKRYV